MTAVGYSARAVRRLFLTEGLVLAAIGSAVGIAGAVAYAALMMAGLRTWWSGAVGTTQLGLHVTPTALFAGAAAVIALAVGVPARVKRPLADVEIAHLEQSWKNYVDYKEKYLKG